MKQRQIVISAVAAAAIIAIGYFGMGALSSRKKSQEKKARPTEIPKVMTQVAKYSDQETELVYFGRVGAFQSVEIISEVSGKILKGSVELKPGQRIRRGALVARIDNKEMRLSLQSQKSQFMKAVAEVLADLKIDFAARFPLWQQYFENLDVRKPLPELPEVTETKEKTFLSTRGIFSSYYSILSQEERLNKYNIYAPVSGTFSQVLLEPGSVANPGSRIATLVRTDQLELILPVQTADVQFISLGIEVEITSEDKDAVWKGKVARIGEKVDVATQSVNVYVRIAPEKNRKLLDGQYMQARIPGSIVRKAMEIPRKAVVDRDKVFVVEDGKLQLKPIIIHKVNSSSLLFSGIEEGEHVVVEPPLNAVTDMEVKIIGS